MSTWLWQPWGPTAVTSFDGTASLTVAQPSIAASGTVVTAITGTASLTVGQPTIAATGSEIYTGAAALIVAQPTIAASGTVVVTITGTASLTVPQPSIVGAGFTPLGTQPAVGGRPHGRRRAVVHRYPERKSRIPVDAHPLYGQLVPIFEGPAELKVKTPRIRAQGLVTTMDEMHEERAVLSLVDDDEDLALALTLADSWMT